MYMKGLYSSIEGTLFEHAVDRNHLKKEEYLYVHICIYLQMYTYIYIFMNIYISVELDRKDSFRACGGSQPPTRKKK